MRLSGRAGSQYVYRLKEMGDGASQILKAQGELDEIRRRDYFDNE